MSGGHGIDTCRCGAVVAQCRCFEGCERRVMYERCPMCAPNAVPLRRAVPDYSPPETRRVMGLRERIQRAERVTSARRPRLG